MGFKKKQHPQASVSKIPLEEAKKLIRAFEADIATNEDTLYGVALFFECLSLMHAAQPSVVETSRKQFRNIIQASKAESEQAEALLNHVRHHPEEAARLRQATFSPCQAHPQPKAMIKRARILVKTYEEIFPGRPRSRPFEKNEILRLLETAAEKLHSA